MQRSDRRRDVLARCRCDVAAARRVGDAAGRATRHRSRLRVAWRTSREPDVVEWRNGRLRGRRLHAWQERARVHSACARRRRCAARRASGSALHCRWPVELVLVVRGRTARSRGDARWRRVDADRDPVCCRRRDPRRGNRRLRRRVAEGCALRLRSRGDAARPRADRRCDFSSRSEGNGGRARRRHRARPQGPVAVVRRERSRRLRSSRRAVVRGSSQRRRVSLARRRPAAADGDCARSGDAWQQDARSVCR